MGEITNTATWEKTGGEYAIDYMKRYNLVSYDEYIESQLARVKSKQGTFLEQPDRLEMFKKIANTAGEKLPKLKRIVCMGVKNGAECFEFKKNRFYCEAEIHGVELSELVKTAKGDDDLKFHQLDFNELPKDWKNKFDFVFSNSLDHSYLVKETIEEWYRILHSKGYMLLTMSSGLITHADVYSFEVKDIDKIFDRNKFTLEKIWTEKGQTTGFNILLKVKALEEENLSEEELLSHYYPAIAENKITNRFFE